VETPQQRALLHAWGVNYVQGYGISKPVALPLYLAAAGAAAPPR
jgi:EAL domain-containing protein (putative c-di-GMP-specific phosphodiesterase class I)